MSPASLAISCTTRSTAPIGTAGPGRPASPGVPDAPGYLYRFAMVQAAPGRLLEVIDLFRARVAVVVAGGDEAPFTVRHSQGDHWDLLMICPMGSWSEYYSKVRLARREAAAAAAGPGGAGFASRLGAMLSWHEDLYVLGPPVDAFRAHVKDAGLLHFEMMQALPGQREALVEFRLSQPELR